MTGIRRKLAVSVLGLSVLLSGCNFQKYCGLWDNGTDCVARHEREAEERAEQSRADAQQRMEEREAQRQGRADRTEFQQPNLPAYEWDQ